MRVYKKWIFYEPKNKSFSVYLPLKPVCRTEEWNSRFGLGSRTVFTASTKQSTYTISERTHPKGSLKEMSDQEAIGYYCRQQFWKNDVKDEISIENIFDIIENTVYSKAYLLIKNGNKYAIRVFRSDDTIFILHVTGDIYNEGTEVFFNSFSLPGMNRNKSSIAHDYNGFFDQQHGAFPRTSNTNHEEKRTKTEEQNVVQAVSKERSHREGDRNMSKAVAFLGLCIVISAFLIGGAMIFINNKRLEHEKELNRFYFGVSDTGIINTVADKITGEIKCRNGINARWSFK